LLPHNLYGQPLPLPLQHREACRDSAEYQNGMFQDIMTVLTKDNILT
jgi:hypothetical protein